MKKRVVFGTLLLAASALLVPATPTTALAKVPAFTLEPVSEFAAALQSKRRAALDVEHANGMRYHAYRFLDPEMVLIGVARAINIDASGRVHIVQAHGQPMGGHLNVTHQEYSHVLLPVGVTPP